MQFVTYCYIWIELSWTELSWIELNRIELNWFDLTGSNCDGLDGDQNPTLDAPGSQSLAQATPRALNPKPRRFQKNLIKLDWIGLNHHPVEIQPYSCFNRAGVQPESGQNPIRFRLHRKRQQARSQPRKRHMLQSSPGGARKSESSPGAAMRL